MLLSQIIKDIREATECVKQPLTKSERQRLVRLIPKLRIRLDNVKARGVGRDKKYKQLRDTAEKTLHALANELALKSDWAEASDSMVVDEEMDSNHADGPQDLPVTYNTGE